jgi:hypothetical protein
MFTAEEYLLDLGFVTARSRLATMTRDGALSRVSEGAYGDGLADLIRAGPAGKAPGQASLTGVRCRQLVTRDASAVLALRWEATGPGGGIFPALDADITLTPAGEHATRLSFAGAYRPAPPASLTESAGDGALRRAAAAAARSLLVRIASALAQPDSAADGHRGSSATAARPEPAINPDGRA